MQVDVVIAGGGPAGSTTARICAQQGLKVAIFDRAKFPRDKPCGGGVNIRAARLLPFDLRPVVEQEVRSVHFSLRRREDLVLTDSQPITLLTRRSRLDHFLLEQSIQAGAELFERSEVKDVEVQPDYLVIHADGKVIRSRALVAADGANGKTARLAGLDIHSRACIGLEGSLPFDEFIPPEWERQIAIDYGGVPGGYGWVFPKSDHLNIGVYGWPSTAPLLREKLQNLVRSYGFDPGRLKDVRGHHLPMRRPGEPVLKGNVLAVGDAAGLVDPFLGEGIYSAIASGTAAAEQLVAWFRGDVPNLNGYQDWIRQNLEPEHQASERFYRVLNLLPRIGVTYFQRFPAAWKMLTGLLRGDQTYQGMRRQMGMLTLGIDLFFIMFRNLPEGKATVSQRASPGSPG